MLWIRFTYNPHSMNCEKISSFYQIETMSNLDPEKGPRLAILNVVGLCRRHLGKFTPRLTDFAKKGHGESIIKPVLPAVTCTAQSTYLTGKLPNEHGVVANGWYDRDLNEHHFWKQSNRLVQGEKFGNPSVSKNQASPTPIFSGGTTCIPV